MDFQQYKLVKEHALAACAAADLAYPKAKQVNPVLQAYIGDVVFSMYVRLRLLPTAAQVRVIHDLGAKMVSAVYQAAALEALEEELTEAEQNVVRRGRNTKSMVPKSASVREYRLATGFEALLGYLLLDEQEERLGEVLDRSFEVIAAKLQEKR